MLSSDTVLTSLRVLPASSEIHKLRYFSSELEKTIERGFDKRRKGCRNLYPGGQTLFPHLV